MNKKEPDNQASDLLGVSQPKQPVLEKEDWEQHRKRQRALFSEFGARGFSETHFLEFLLFFSIPRRDTKPIAKALLREFGSLHKVLDAKHEELIKIKGVGENTAMLIQFAPCLFSAYEKSKASALTNDTLDTNDKICNYMMSLFKSATKETVMVALLNAQKRIISCRPVSEGSVTMTYVPTRNIVELALKQDAVYVVIAHNHPGGNALPSQEDKLVTMKINAALAAVGIKLLDHVVVANNDCISFAQSRMLT